MPRDLQLTFRPGPEPPPLDEAALLPVARRNLRGEEVEALRVLKVSFDARHRHRVWRVAVRCFEPGEPIPEPPRTTPEAIAAPGPSAPHAVVIGSGPAGLFCALALLAGGVRVTVLERGRDVRTRRRAIRALNRGEPADPDGNYCFGEGGAGTYSDGKLYTRTGRKRDVRGVLETLVAHGAPTDILVSGRPHVGSNRLPDVVAALRKTILEAGGDVRFGERAEEIETKDGGVRAVVTRSLDTNELHRIDADACVLATGHSARDSIEMAARAGARLEPKGFAMGVRVEHPQEWLDDRQYDGLRGPCDLPAANYELAAQTDGRGVYSFCMCPGGFIVPATTASDRVVVNGMSLSRRDSPFANSGVVVAIEPEDWCGERGEDWGFDQLLALAGRPSGLPEVPEQDPLFGVRIQEALEHLAALAGGGAGRAPGERVDHLVDGYASAGSAPPPPTSYRPGVTDTPLVDVLPPGIFERLRHGLIEFDRKLPGFVTERGVALGVESRTSSPVRVARDDESLESLGVARLYPSGEGAGYAGGIVSAALDGERVAQALLAKLVP